MSLRYSYVTNGLSDHRLGDALHLLADNGYDGVGLTLDHHHLDPFSKSLSQDVNEVAKLLRDTKLALVIETGGRFVLDPRHKHHPNLLSASGSERRVELLEISIRIANELGAEAVSFWSGIKSPEMSDETAWQMLVSACEQLTALADRLDVVLAFEPEPGMFIESSIDWAMLKERIDSPRFQMTLDIGHCVVAEASYVDQIIHDNAASIANIQIEDMKQGVHEHLDFGDGDVDFHAAIGALKAIDYNGLVSVELSRHSHAAHVVVPRAIEFLRSIEANA